MAPINTADIMLTFTWDARFEDLFASWHREIALAERAHRRSASHLSHRNAIVAGLLVVLTLLMAGSAFASARIAPRAMASVGIDEEAVPWAIGTMGVLAALLAMLQTLARYASRADTHRIAAIRYGSLEREMATTLAMPRAARPQPDASLTEARERMDRYAKESPAVPDHVRRRVEVDLHAEASATDASRPSSSFLMADTPRVAEP